MSVAVKKVNGVESVKVSLKEGMAHIQLAPSNTLSLEQLRKAINEQGFTPKDATVIVRGDLFAKGDGMLFKVSGSTDTFEVDSHQGIRVTAGGTVTLKGFVAAPQAGKAARLEIKEVLKF